MAPEIPFLNPSTSSPSSASKTRAQSNVYTNSIPYLPQLSQTQTDMVPSAISSQQTVASYDVQTPQAPQSPRPAVQIRPLSSQRLDTNTSHSVTSSQQNIGIPQLSQLHSNGIDGSRPSTPTRTSLEAEQQSYRDVNNESSPSPDASGSPTHGSKRTASGAVKQHSPPLPSPAKVRGHVGHSRNISLDSNISRVSELSAQLKSRLSYAMVKVQNGWEKRSIDEVETLAASQLNSPTSATSTNQSGLASPRKAIVSANRTSRDLSSITGIARSHEHNNYQHPRPMPRGTVYTTHHHENASNLAVPTLAPAPELKPSTSTNNAASRRNHAAHASTPSLPGVKTLNGDSQSPTHVTPTPQEQDAVDTLLFMSSPANSGHFPPHLTNSAQPSPLRSTFPRLAETSGRASTGSDSDEARAAKRRSLGLKSEADVERVLAQIVREETAGSDEEFDSQVPNRVEAMNVGVR